MSPRGRSISRLLLALVLGLAAACGEQPGDPAAEIRALVGEAEAAAEAGDLRALAEMLDDEYADEQGRDRRATLFLLRSLLGRYPRREILVRGVEVETLSPALANARVRFAVLARDPGRPLPAGLDAELRELSLGLAREDGRWRVLRASGVGLR